MSLRLLVAGSLVLGAVLTSANLSTNLGRQGRPCGIDFAQPNLAMTRDPITRRQNRLVFWDAKPILLGFANEAPVKLNGKVYSGRAIVTQAASKWVDASGGRLNIKTVSRAKDAHILVEFKMIPGRPNDMGRAGETRLTYNPTNGSLISAKVTLYVWPRMTYKEVFKGLSGVAAHELGHALFLDGHSPHKGDLMAVGVNLDRVTLPSVRDRNTLLTAYCGQF